MKQKDEKRSEQKGLRIQMRTLVNGYLLEVNGEGFMFFDAQSLLEGFCIHVGLERLSEMTKKETKNLLRAIQDGSVARKLQEEVNQLNAELEEQQNLVRNLKAKIKKMKDDRLFY